VLLLGQLIFDLKTERKWLRICLAWCNSSIRGSLSFKPHGSH